MLKKGTDTFFGEQGHGNQGHGNQGQARVFTVSSPPRRMPVMSEATAAEPATGEKE